ncbi:hypothetical protein J4436_03455 [Candidatus Woesearchaeota archaeon]|nr:hypothetical protein [Candidatus Woesearchaeota archaeon]
MVEEQNYNNIKAGVSGVIEAPSPSQTSETPVSVESAPMTTEMNGGFSGGGNEEYYNEENVAQNINIDTDRIHEIVEAVVNEKWDNLMGNLGNLTLWKERVESNITAMKQELVRINDKFENMQNAMVGRVKIYDDNIRGIHDEMKALEKVFEKILDPLVMNIRELGKITEEIKRHHR